MVWHHLDLTSIRLFKRELPIAILIMVDALGFLSFLALLITNGIVASHLGYWRPTGHAVLLAYASVPWMFCWSVQPGLDCVSMLIDYCGSSAIHGFVLFQNVVRAVRSRRCSTCPNCRRSWEITAAKGPARVNYSQVVSGYDSDDVEATPPEGSDTSEGHEQVPEMRESIDGTNETSRLMFQNS